MKSESIIYHEPNYRTEIANLQLLRVSLTKEHSKFDFGYQATDHYIKGGWVRIGKNTFIRVKGSNKKHILVRAENIPIGPDVHHFETTKDWLYFSLYFPPLSIENGIIDLIENEKNTKGDFNFWDIVLK